MNRRGPRWAPWAFIAGVAVLILVAKLPTWLPHRALWPLVAVLAAILIAGTGIRYLLRRGDRR